jgi:hypothetical protein
MIGGTTIVGLDMKIGDNDEKNLFSLVNLYDMYVILKTDSSSREVKIPIHHYTSNSPDTESDIWDSWIKVCEAYRKDNARDYLYDADLFFSTDSSHPSLKSYLNYIKTNNVTVSNIQASNYYHLPEEAYIVLYGKDQYIRDGQNLIRSKIINNKSTQIGGKYHFPNSVLFLQSTDLYNGEIISIALGTSNQYLKIGKLPSYTKASTKEDNVDIDTISDSYTILSLQNNFGASHYKGDLYTYSSSPNIFFQTTNLPKINDNDNESKTQVIPITYFIPESASYTNAVKTVRYYKPNVTVCTFDSSGFTYEPKNIQRVQLLSDSNIVSSLVNEYSLSGVNEQCDLFAGQGYSENNKCTQTFANLFTNNSAAITANDISPRLNPTDSSFIDPAEVITPQDTTTLLKFSFDYEQLISEISEFSESKTLDYAVTNIKHRVY